LLYIHTHPHIHVVSMDNQQSPPLSRSQIITPIALIIASIIGFALIIFAIVSAIMRAAAPSSDGYHTRTRDIWYREQSPSCGAGYSPNCDGDISRPGYRDSINRDQEYRSYMSAKSPYAYDNSRHCTTHYYNACDRRRSGSRAVNMGRWYPVVKM
jgi:hypothetical protein